MTILTIGLLDKAKNFYDCCAVHTCESSVEFDTTEIDHFLEPTGSLRLCDVTYVS